MLNTEPVRRGVNGNLNSEIDRYRRAMERYEAAEKAKRARAKLKMMERRLAEQKATGDGPVEPIVIDKDALRRIIFEVSAKTGFSVQAILSERRTAPLVRARHECFWRAKEETSFSLTQIAHAYNRADHSTIIHGIAMHEKRMADASGVIENV